MDYWVRDQTITLEVGGWRTNFRTIFFTFSKTKNIQNFKMILQLILKYRNGSNFAHTFLNTIKSSGANPPENFFFNHVNVCMYVSMWVPFSSDNSPLTEVSLSSSCLNFMTRSALTNQFFLNGLTISSRSTRCTSLYSWISCVVGGRYSKQSKTLEKKF